MKIGVDINIEVDNLQKNNSLNQDINAGEFDSILNSLIAKLDLEELDVEDILNGDASLKQEITALLGENLTTANQLLLREFVANPQNFSGAITDRISALAQNNEISIALNTLESKVEELISLDDISEIKEVLTELQSNLKSLGIENPVINDKISAIDSQLELAAVSPDLIKTVDENLTVNISELKALITEEDKIEYQIIESTEVVSNETLQVIGNLNAQVVEQPNVTPLRLRKNDIDSIENVKNIYDLQIAQYSQGSKDIGFTPGLVGQTQLTSSDIQVNQLNIINAIKSKLESTTNNELHKLSVRLHPEELGRVNIELNMKDGIISGVVRLNEDQAKAVFAENLEAIKVELQSQGIKIDSLDINLSNDNSNTSMFKEDSFNQFKENREQRNFGNSKQDSRIEAVTRKRVNNVYREEGRVNILI
jgi:flagellar hook-length control protein FliK